MKRILVLAVLFLICQFPLNVYGQSFDPESKNKFKTQEETNEQYYIERQKEKFRLEDERDKEYIKRQQEKFKAEDEYNKKTEAIIKVNGTIDQIIDITTYYKANRPIPGYPNNYNIYLPFYPYFFRNTFPHAPIPPPPQQ